MENRMTAQQLKNSILQMAVQGKLVSQDPNDEPASVLLERIRKEKEQLIKDGKIKKNKKESYIFRGADNLHYEQIGKEIRCIEDELPFEIPGSWEWCKLGNISTYTQTNPKIKPSDVAPNTWELNLEDIEKGGKLLQRKRVFQCNSKGDKTVFSKNDILYSKLRPYLLKVLVADEDGICTSEIVPFKVYSNILPEYIVLILKSPFIDSYINSVTYGVKMPRAGTDTMINLYVPLAPINEQKNILKKIKELEPIIEKYKKVENELYILNSNIKEQLKKSILQYAIEGNLVQQDPNDEPAFVLLERIREEKNKLVAEGKIKKDKNESIIYRRDNSYYEKFDKCERCINDQIPFEIPNSWCWERLSSFCIINMGSSPKGNSINSDEKGGYEFHQGKSFFSSKHLLKSNVYTNQPTKLCPSSSVLLSVRAPVGKVNIVDRTICIGRGLASIKPFIDFEIELLYYFLTTLEPYFIDHSTGSTFKAITSNIVKECLLPVPPKNVQNRLLVAIKKIFSLLN